jgi:hypothetical protein
MEEKDTDGDLVYRIRIQLQDGRELPLQGHPSPGEAQAREHAGVIRRFLGLHS